MQELCTKQTESTKGEKKITEHDAEVAQLLNRNGIW